MMPWVNKSKRQPKDAVAQGQGDEAGCVWAMPTVLCQGLSCTGRSREEPAKVLQHTKCIQCQLQTSPFEELCENKVFPQALKRQLMIQGRRADPLFILELWGSGERISALRSPLDYPRWGWDPSASK